MRFNLLLYVPALVENLNIEYGIFIQHHLMDDADIELNYFDFSKINSENYALDIVDKNEVTKKVRKDCLVEGFTLNSHYSIDLDKGYNRNISKDEVRQIFICFKNTSKQPIDAFIRMTHDGETHNYHIKDDLIFFQLWVAPEMQDSSDIALNIGKVNYSDFAYFCTVIKEEINKQWHLILNAKRDISKEKLIQDKQEIAYEEESPQSPSNPVKLKNIFIQPSDAQAHVIPTATEAQTMVIPAHDTIPLSSKKGAESFKIIAYSLLLFGIISILGKILGV